MVLLNDVNFIQIFSTILEITHHILFHAFYIESFCYPLL